MAMLKESRAQVEEAAARSQLVEAKHSQEVALAKKEVPYACMHDLVEIRFVCVCALQ